MTILESNLWQRNPEWKENWDAYAANYEWTDGVPKGFV
eukprot:CAMPEP_0170474418 /NCGR_PEP_ID=MMETSP0123-20130129/16217_1 /TAXON_ID=182087 /ORGANISM="Favella ehrenbergii, Strain Fehren 1" /LENGTH=37 /DNA_ID= /DNA_START= /DNA_END= /DNA_ORIENTATION=